jgi:tetratricopeptide (TPR) repeat protein
MRPLLSTLLLLAAGPLLSASPQFDAARELYQQRKNAEARAAFEQVVAAEPTNLEAQQFLGRTWMRLDDPEAAIKVFEKLVAAAPNQSGYHRELGDAYGRKAQKAGLGFSGLGAARKCRAAYEKAVELDPASLEARQSLLGFYQQAPGIVGGGMDKAHAQADEMIKLDAVRGKIAKAGLYTREKKFDEAFALFEQTLAVQPDDYAALYQFGRLAADSGQRLDRGLEALKKCLAMTPPAGAPGHAPTHWRIGNIWEKKGDKTAAKSAYEAALAVDPKFQPAAEALKKLG